MPVPDLSQSAVSSLSLSHAAGIDAQSTRAPDWRLWGLFWEVELSTDGAVQLGDVGEGLIRELADASGAESYGGRCGY